MQCLGAHRFCSSFCFQCFSHNKGGRRIGSCHPLPVEGFSPAAVFPEGLELSHHVLDLPLLPGHLADKPGEKQPPAPTGPGRRELLPRGVALPKPDSPASSPGSLLPIFPRGPTPPRSGAGTSAPSWRCPSPFSPPPRTSSQSRAGGGRGNSPRRQGRGRRGQRSHSSDRSDTLPPVPSSAFSSVLFSDKKRRAGKEIHSALLCRHEFSVPRGDQRHVPVSHLPELFQKGIHVPVSSL